MPKMTLLEHRAQALRLYRRRLKYQQELNIPHCIARVVDFVNLDERKVATRGSKCLSIDNEASAVSYAFFSTGFLISDCANVITHD